MAQERGTKRDPSQSTFIRIPNRLAPHANFRGRGSVMWVKMVARELVSQSTANRGDITLGKIGATFMFIAPETITETHNHSWEEYDSLQKRLLEKVKGFAKVGEEIGEIKNLAMNAGGALRAAEAGGTLSQKAINTVNTAVGGGAGRVIHTKVDAPLVYVTSERRKIQFEFDLPKLTESDDIVGAVKQIQQYSAPSIKGGNSIFINPPYIFTITTEPGSLINYSYCACDSVQPSWQAPYRNGEPLMCKLTLSFTDLSPLFATTVKKGSVINVKPAT